MKHPDKWRETVDPISLPYRHFQLTEVLGYPHAGNGKSRILRDGNPMKEKGWRAMLSGLFPCV